MKNLECLAMIETLKKHLDRTDLIGFAAARNIKILQIETQEYVERRDSLILKYGTEEVDEFGTITGEVSLAIDSPEFESFKEDMNEWDEIEVFPDVYKIPVSEVEGKLSGTEILEIDWMLEGF